MIHLAFLRKWNVEEKLENLFIFLAYNWLSCSVDIIFITSIRTRRTRPADFEIYWQKPSSTKKFLEKAKFRRASPISFSSPMDSSSLIVQLSVSIGLSALRWCNPPMTRILFSILSATTPLRLSLVSLSDQGFLRRRAMIILDGWMNSVRGGLIRSSQWLHRPTK